MASRPSRAMMVSAVKLTVAGETATLRIATQESMFLSARS